MIGYLLFCLMLSCMVLLPKDISPPAILFNVLFCGVGLRNMMILNQ
jgi:hypothetical protein